MKFETLRPDFLQLSDSDRFQFFAAYRSKRHTDLVENTIAKVTVQKERTKGQTDKKISVTKEQLAALRRMGLA